MKAVVGRRGRRLAMGLATALGLSRRGFFMPYRRAADVPWGGACPPYRPLEGLIAEGMPGYTRLLTRLVTYAPALAAIGERAAPPAPRWGQDWFPRLDAAIAYVMTRDRAPARIIEVGSGHSTRFLRRAVGDGRLATKIVAIDPEPRASLAGLGVEIVPATVQQAGLAPFRALGKGDVLFVDSSHLLVPGSDVDFILNVVLPTLPPGVLVHFHDVFLPDGYPAEWDWRGYNEQSAVAALLQGGAYRLLFASHFVVTRMAGALAASPARTLPMPTGAHESSLWLIKEPGGPTHSRDLTAK